VANLFTDRTRLRFDTEREELGESGECMYPIGAGDMWSSIGVCNNEAVAS